MQPVFFTFVVGFVAAFLVGLIYFDKKDSAYRIQNSLFFGIFGIMFFLAISAVADEVLPKRWSENYESIKLINVKDGEGFSGSFFVGIGGFSTTHFYTYYREWKGGFKKEILTPATLRGEESDVIIFEESRTDGELRVFRQVYAENWYNFVGLPPRSTKYEFHIPKGSITREFELR